MKKNEYLEKLDNLGFSKEDYCIISGGSMLMFGLREETGDIDLKISDTLFNDLNEKGLLKESPKMANLYEYGEDVELKAHEFNLATIEYIDGYPVESLEANLKWKLENNRDKDQEDIKKIQEYLENRKNN